MSQQPLITAGEKTILYSQGGYKVHPRSGWKLGHHYLTNKRLYFSQSMGIMFETPLSNIRTMIVERAKFVLGRKNVLCLSYMSPKTGAASQAWLIVNDIERWRRKIDEMTAPVIDEETIDRIARELDPYSRDILEYLWRTRHAQIDALAELIAAPSHMDVLLRIRNNINPIAEKITGRPILVFEKSRVDYETGERVLFSWWIIEGRQPTRVAEGERCVDVFDEGDHINVVMDLAGVQEKDVLVRVEGRKLSVSTNTTENPLYEEVHLPAEVDPRECTKRYKNNILEVRLEKISDG